MYLSIKLLLLPVVVTLLVYFRAVIFQPHISQYADDAQEFLEQRYDITIPVHIVENSENEFAINQLSESSHNTDSESENDILSDKNITDETSSIPEASVSDIADVNDETAIDSPRVVKRVVEQEIFIILNNDSSEKSKNIDSVDKVNQETVEATLQPEAGLEVEEVTDALDNTVNDVNDVSDVNDEVVQSNSQEVIDVKNNAIDPAVMEKLSDTVDIINRKVDMLFNINEHNNETKLSSANSDDFAIIKNNKGRNNSKNPVPDYVEPKRNAREMLLVARQTFWNGNPLGSEKIYLDLVKLHESSPDVYGELGNVYYSQGKWEQAGKAYYQAAVRLLDLKQTQQVNYLLRVIQGLDAESAEKLKLKISG